jgi:hypothetical protein
MCDLSTAVAWAQIVSSIAAIVGVPVLIVYTIEAGKLRRVSQKQLDALRSPIIFFDNPVREAEKGWENIDIVNGGAGPALNVEYRIGDNGEKWVAIPALMSGERRKIDHEIGHMIDQAIRNRQADSTIYVRCRGWSGGRYESRAKLESSDDITFHLKVQRPRDDKETSDA